MKLNKTEKAVLIYIRKIQGKNDFARIKNQWLSEKLEVSVRTIQRAKKTLIGLGLITQKQVRGNALAISTLPIDARASNIVKFKIKNIKSLKRNQFTFQANGEPIMIEERKTYADKLSLVMAIEGTHPIENVTPIAQKMSPPLRQSSLDNLTSNPNGLDTQNSNQELFPKIEKPKRPKSKKNPTTDLQIIESYIFNLWDYLGKDFYYNYPKERRQIKLLLKIATVNEICNRFLQLLQLIESDDFYKNRPLTPTGLTYHVLNKLQSINDNTKEQINQIPFSPKKRRAGKLNFPIYLELSARKKGFHCHLLELRAIKNSQRKTFAKEEIFF